MTMKGTRKIEAWSRRRVLRGMLEGGALDPSPLAACTAAFPNRWALTSPPISRGGTAGPADTGGGAV